MRCHEILGISEKDSAGRIQDAYKEKMSILHNYAGLLDPEQYKRKENELEKAREECLLWKKRSFSEKLKFRMDEALANRLSPAYAQECCFGPCTFTDLCCYEACCRCEPSNTHSFCAASCGEGGQFVPIICDVVCYAGMLIGISKAIMEEAERKAAEKAAEREDIRRRLEANRNVFLLDLEDTIADKTDAKWGAFFYQIQHYPKKRKSDPADAEVTREFALSVVKKREQEIAGRFIAAVERSDYSHAIEIAELLLQVSQEDAFYENAIAVLMSMINPQMPFPVYMEDLEQMWFGNPMWHFAMQEPFNPYYVKAYFPYFPKENGIMNPQIVALLLYLKRKYDMDLVLFLYPEFEEDFAVFMEKGDGQTVASIIDYREQLLIADINGNDAEKLN